MELTRRRRRTAIHLWLGALLATFVVLISMLAAIGLNEQLAHRPLADNYQNYCENEDDLAPEIELVGGDKVYLTQGDKYVEPGVEIYDYCETYPSEVVGTVDASTPGDYQLKYRVTDTRGNETEAVRVVKVRSSGQGVVYLTFDDGPGPYTSELLDVLAKYGVKATFFVTGAGDDALIAREYREGHALGLHTTSHNYAYVYQNVETFMADLNSVQERVRQATGETVKLMRFPGGSSNLVSRKYDGGARIMSRLVTEVERQGFVYFDWNVDSDDAGRAKSAEAVFQNVVAGFREGGQAVVLQHDVKGYSVAAVERIIQYGLEHGYVFDRLTANSFTAHHRVNN